MQGSELLIYGVLIVGMIAVMYFLIIRPQRKQEKEHQSLLSQIKKGDKVVTTAGMHGIVEKMDDYTIDIRFASGAVIKFDKSAVARLQSEPEEESK